jgi:hypothetical protein
MSEAVELVAQINTEWRVVLIPAQGRTTPAWSLERLAGDAWQGQGFIRSARMLRWLAAGCGPIDEAAAAILEALPPRVDIVAMSPEERREAVLAKRRKRPRVAKRGLVDARFGRKGGETFDTRRGSTAAQPPAVPITAPADAVPIVAAVVSRLCDNCGAEFTLVAHAFRARRCSPACRREFQIRYQRDRRARDAGFHERARLEQAARRAASKARREAREIALATAAAQPIDSDMAEYWRVNHGVRL